jgi:hypothetical protein
MWRKWIKEERGGALAILVMFITFSIALSAVVVDVGRLYYTKADVQDRAEAVALAAVQDIVNGEYTAKRVAQEYADINGLYVTSIEANEIEKTVTVIAEDTIPLYFAKIFGRDQQTLTGKAKAKLGVVGGTQGILPLGVENQPFNFGSQYTLKFSAGGSQQGNFGALALGGTGAAKYRSNLQNGYQGWLEVGMEIDTESGDMTGPTRQGLADRYNADVSNMKCRSIDTVDRSCQRLLYIPIIDSLDVNGSKPVKIIGFAAFYLMEIVNGSQVEVKGQFIRTVLPGEWSEDENAHNYGLYSPKLVR